MDENPYQPPECADSLLTEQSKRRRPFELTSRGATWGIFLITAAPWLLLSPYDPWLESGVAALIVFVGFTVMLGRGAWGLRAVLVCVGALTIVWLELRILGYL